MGRYDQALAREIEKIGERELLVEAIKKTGLQKLPQEIVNTLKEYVDFLSISGKGGKSLSTRRKYAYLIRLRKIASMIPDKFLNPAEKDLMRVVRTIRETNVKWG